MDWQNGIDTINLSYIKHVVNKYKSVTQNADTEKTEKRTCFMGHVRILRITMAKQQLQSIVCASTDGSMP